MQNLDYCTGFFLSILLCHFFFSHSLPFYQNLFCNFYYPADQPSISLLPSPCPRFFLSFFSCGTMQLGRILLSLFRLHLVVLYSSLFLFPAQFICFVIQLLPASHVLLLLLVPDHLFICHQVQHVLLAEHLQLPDSFSSKNAGCYQHWYNWTELWLWTVIRSFLCDKDYKENRKHGPVQFSERTGEGFLTRLSQV